VTGGGEASTTLRERAQRKRKTGGALSEEVLMGPRGARGREKKGLRGMEGGREQMRNKRPSARKGESDCGGESWHAPYQEGKLAETAISIGTSGTRRP